MIVDCDISVSKNPRHKMAPLRPSSPPVKIEWQFKDQNGDWTTVGLDPLNSNGGHSSDTSTSSEFIERHRIRNPKEETLFIRNQGHRLKLDFLRMTQTHLKSFITSPIRRVNIEKKTTSTTKSHIKRPKLCCTLNIKIESESILAPEHEWYFMDEMNRWVKYGQPNTLEKLSCVTSVTSDDIEKHYQVHPTQRMEIESQRHKYVLNFDTMTQTNKETLVRRSITRRRKATIDVFGTPRNKRQSSDSVENSVPVPPVLPFPGKSSCQTKKKLKSSSQAQLSGSEVFPTHWTPMTGIVLWTKVQIGPPNSKYIEHISAIKKILPKLKIKTMYQVQNRYLWEAYSLRKNNLETRYPGNTFREEFLYHGTDPCNVEGICEENIDWRLHGSKHGQRFGRGSYFSNS